MMKYAVIIPAKNEERDLTVTLEGITNQSLLPEVVLIIDNNSTDGTAEVIKEYANKYPYVLYLFDNKGKGYELGAPIVRLFNRGLEYLTQQDYQFEYIVKMDADVKLETDTFERINEYIHEEQHPPGILSCIPSLSLNGRIKQMISPEWHTNGQLKIYNLQCLDEIGGLKADLGWDCADNIQAMQKKWKTYVIPYLTYELSRPVGRYSLKKGAVRQGLGAYKLRHSILYVLLKMFHDMFRKPYVLFSLYYFYGYISGAFKRKKRILNKKEGKMLRKLLWASFLKRLRKNQFILLQKNKSNMSPTYSP